MRLMNLYFYTFYRLYKRLQINPWGDGTYIVAIITLIALEVWILHCLLGNVALIAGTAIIRDEVILFFSPASVIVSSAFTYVTICRHFRGHQCIVHFDKWPRERHKLAGLLLRGLVLLLMMNTIWMVEWMEN
jgi:tRNA A37 threonylcarbamoyladenosine biosynthesis protein TsaE